MHAKTLRQPMQLASALMAVHLEYSCRADCARCCPQSRLLAKFPHSMPQSSPPTPGASGHGSMGYQMLAADDLPARTGSGGV